MGIVRKKFSSLHNITYRTHCQEESGAPCDFSVEIGLPFIGATDLPQGRFRRVPPAGAGGAPAGFGVRSVCLFKLKITSNVPSARCRVFSAFGFAPMRFRAVSLAPGAFATKR